MLHSPWKRVALQILLCAGAALPASAQLIDQPLSGDVSVNYTADIANAGPGACGCFALQGGGVNARLAVTDRLSAVADFSVVHVGTVSGANYGLGLMTLMAGTQFRHRLGHYTPYGQFLLGAVRGFDSVFPASTSSSASAFIFEAGGGSEMVVTPKFSARIFELDYMRTDLPNNANNWQNHLKISAGIVYHF
jgi:hypothetical protein